MATTLYRLIKYGFQTFRRQRLLTVATMVVILLALLVSQGLFISGVVGSTALDAIQDKIDISVYFKVNTPEDEVLRVKKELEDIEEVSEVEYISRDKALEIFRERHVDDETITQALEELDENPLSASLNIKAENPEEYAQVASYLEDIVSEELVDNITYNQNQAVIDRLGAIIRVSRQIGLLVAVFLTVVAVLVSFNTILLGIYSNRDEISIMRLVGASNLYVRGPFVVLGLIYGFITAILSMLLTTPVVFLSSKYVTLFVPEMNLAGYFVENFIWILLFQLSFGIGIGVFSSVIAIRRYLKV